MDGRVLADVQVACDVPGVPTQDDIEDWLDAAFSAAPRTTAAETEVSVRIVDEAESRQLNNSYRNKDRATNVLAFPVDLPDIGEWPEDMPLPLGDLVICAPVVTREAAEQGKELRAHWGHMLVHGMLHLLGFDHETDVEASAMESLEAAVLDARGVENPYEERRLN